MYLKDNQVVYTLKKNNVKNLGLSRDVVMKLLVLEVIRSIKKKSESKLRKRTGIKHLPISCLQQLLPMTMFLKDTNVQHTQRDILFTLSNNVSLRKLTKTSTSHYQFQPRTEHEYKMLMLIYI